MKLYKKAFAFTFLALFLSMVILAFVHLSLSDGDFTKDNIYKESRIAYVNDELKYFKQTYLPNAVSYTLYNTLAALGNYSKDDVNYAKFQQNYSRFNEFVMEGMIYGSFNGTLQPTLWGENRTILYFIDLFRDDFVQNYKGNFTFDIININVYEEKPYYITARIYANLTVTTEDNMSSWQSMETIEVAVPIYELNDPLFIIMEDKNVRLSASEFNFPVQNWTLASFEEAMNQTYSTVYFDITHKYSLGDSFLNRFLNTTSHAYKNVVAFWSFDYDVDEGEVYDTAGNVNYTTLFGNSRILFNFDNNTIAGAIIPDLTHYENDGTIVGADCNKPGVRDTGCFFDDVGDYINVVNGVDIVNEVSVFAWIFVLGSTVQDSQRVVCAANEYFCLWVNNNGTAQVRLNGAVNTDGFTQISFNDANVTMGKWHHIGFTYNGSRTYLYVDGLKFIDYSNLGGSDSYIGNLASVPGALAIGNIVPALNRPFNGTIDEVGVYSKALSDDEVALLYREKKALQLDYVESFHEIGVELDGLDDYINLTNSSALDFNNKRITIEAWVKFDNLSHRNVIIDRGLALGNGWGLDVTANDVSFGLHNGWTATTTSNPIALTDKWYHIVVIGGDGTLPRIYVNGFAKSFVDNGGNVTFSSVLSSDVIMGASSDTLTDKFEGIIDEIKIYNRSLSADEIKSNYYNYDSLSKGCCNYITLIDPEKFGYDNIAYLTNTSYSSKMFYNYHRRGIQPNIVLWNISTITSHNVGTKYYNFLLDQCMIEAFNVLDYQNQTISVDYQNINGIGTCNELVKQGYY